MEEIKLLSLFSGIGAIEKALTNQKIPFELVGFSEIDQSQIDCYCAIHNVDKNKNLGDIRLINEKVISDFNLLVFGFPCTDISGHGFTKGFKEGTNTKSSLIWDTIRILRYHKPKYVIIENVQDLTFKTFKEDFENLLKVFKESGYKVNWKCLNAKNFNLPQNRIRTFIVLIKEEFILNKDFIFPLGNTTPPNLIDFIDKNNSDLSLNLSDLERGLILEKLENGNVKIKNGCDTGFLIAEYGDGINLSYTSSTTRRGRVIKKSVGALNTVKSFGVLLENHFIRKLSEEETFLLQGFTKEDYQKCKKVVIYKNLYFNSGNSIPVTILEEILKVL